MTQSSRRLSSLARQHSPSPTVVVATGSRPLPVSVRPRLPSSSPPLPPPLPSRRRPCHPVNLRHPVPLQSLSPPSRLCRRRRRQSRAFWVKTYTEELVTNKSKAKECRVIYYHNFEEKRDIQRGQIWNDRSQKQKKEGNYRQSPKWD